MHPILLRADIAGHQLVLGSYSTFMVLAWIAMVAVGTLLARSRGLSWRRALAVFSAALAAGVGGARLLDLAAAGRLQVTQPTAEQIALLAQPNFTAFALYGGLVVGSLGAIAAARLLRMPVWKLADCAAPALAVGIALMRVGCFLRGCCFGRSTDLPWGVTFPPGSPAWAHQVLSGQSGLLGLVGDVHAVHPTQLYELAAVLLIAVAATLWARQRDLPDGVVFLVFALAFTLFRWGNGLLRASVPGASAPAWFYPALYSAVVVTLGAILAVRLLRHRALRADDVTAAMSPHSSDVSAPIASSQEPPPLPWELSATSVAPHPIPAENSGLL
jgi:phosphatidylglycerol---prolipoprotein diacylglyceryl transferase